MKGLPRGWVIAASFVVALMLTALPLPAWAAPWRPAWVAMVLIYWCLATPERTGLYVAFAVGLLLDVLLSAPLGQNALGLTVLGFLTIAAHNSLRLYPLGQQAIAVGLLVLCYLTTTFIVRYLAGFKDFSRLQHWYPVLSSTILWPWLFILLRDLRRRAQLSA